jgi:hypothetical protein
MTAPNKNDCSPKRPLSVMITDPQPGDRMRDELLADPILDRLPQQRGKRQVRSVLAILDQLNREERTR